MARATLRLIDRGDLLAALDRAAAKKVTIVSAPAGSGKTSLLRAWADRPGQPHRLAVMQVQRDQQDAQQFWLALLGAVRRASGTTSGAEPPAVTPEFNGRAMVDRVLSELEDHPGRGVLVIDDLHELRSRDALVQLTRLLTNLPPSAHAVLATRRDLRLRLHQLRLAGELAEIRAEDLRFTERETCELLGASGITLSEVGAALLHQRTEGWAAGVRLAERWLQRAMRALQADTGADIRLLVHIVNGMLRACRGHHHEALQEFSAAEHLGSRLADSHALASQVTGWMLAAQARAAIGALADERVGSSEIHNARAAVCLAERDPAGALARCGMSWTARHRLSVTSRSSRLSCWPASPIVSSVSVTGPRRCSARGSCSCYRPTVHTSPAVTGSR